MAPAERLIVAADYKPKTKGPQAAESVRAQVLALANKLGGTGVVLKVNSALRACGYDLIAEIHDRGLRVMADLKVCDIDATLETDGSLLRESKPYLLTVMCGAGYVAMSRLKAELPDTEVLGVTVLTSLKDADAWRMYGCSVEEAVMRFAPEAAAAEIDGLVSSPAEVQMLRAKFGDVFSYNTPGIRPLWSVVEGDDQNPDRVMTPAKAIKAGASRIVVGRPITQSDKPYESVLRTIDEIISALP